jgi:hypothetical protein
MQTLTPRGARNAESAGEGDRAIAEGELEGIVRQDCRRGAMQGESAPFAWSSVKVPVASAAANLSSNTSESPQGKVHAAGRRYGGERIVHGVLG